VKYIVEEENTGCKLTELHLMLRCVFVAKKARLLFSNSVTFDQTVLKKKTSNEFNAYAESTNNPVKHLAVLILMPLTL